MTRTRRGPQGEGNGRQEAFEGCRALLFSVAYRILGSVMAAEDVVQEAYPRWRALPDGEGARSTWDHLAAVAVRLCLDRLRAAKRRREEYVGPSLPEPLPAGTTSLADPLPAPSEGPALDENLSMAFLVLPESLTPTERAVFLMRDVSDYDYAEVSRLVRRPRFGDSPERRERLTRGFVEASGTARWTPY